MEVTFTSKKNSLRRIDVSLETRQDIIITVAISGFTDVAEDIFHFVDIGNKECFAPLLYVCFDPLRLDVMEELSWQHGLNDFYMLYNIQVSRTIRGEKLAALEKEVRERSKKEFGKEQQEAEAPIIITPAHLMIANW